jgi:hypothetical protein
LLDTFGDPSTFAQHWALLGVGQALPEPGSVTLVPSFSDTFAGITALDNAGQPIAGISAVHGRAHASPVDGRVGVVAGASANGGYGCSVSAMTVLATELQNQTYFQNASELLGSPLGDEVTLSLSIGLASPPQVSCIALYGLALGASYLGATFMLTGGAGAAAYSEPARFTGIALMRHQQGACPVPILR